MVDIRMLRSVAIIVLMLVCACGVTVALNAVRKTAGAKFGPSKHTQSAESQADDGLRARYHEQISQIAERHQKLIDDDGSRHVKKIRGMAEKPSDDETTKLKRLQASALSHPDKKLSLDLEDNANACSELVPTSNMSAKVFASLRKQQLVDDDALLKRLRPDAEFLSDGWISLLKSIAAESKADTLSWRLARFVLYRAGASQKEYRPLLEEWASKGSWDALDTILFPTDKVTGLSRVAAAPDNLALVSRLGKSTDYAWVKAAYADYLAETGDV